MLVVAMATANPVNKEKLMNQDPIKTIKYFWNEEIGEDRSAQVMNLWNEGIKEYQNKDVYAMRDDSEDGAKENEDGGGNRKGDQDKEVKAMNLWNKEMVNNEGRFKANIEGPGRHTYMYYIVLIVILTVYVYFFLHISHPCHNNYSDCWTKPLDQALQFTVVRQIQLAAAAGPARSIPATTSVDVN